MTLGQRLQARRNELGKSLAQISSATKIHVKILTALESDEYNELPAKTFTRGFIVSYCKALGLDAEATIAEHQDFLEQKFTERKGKDKGHQGYVFEGKELEQNKRWMIFGVSAAALFAIAVLLVFKPQNHKRKEKHKEFTEEVADNNEDAADPNADEMNSPSAEGSAPAVSSPSASNASPAFPGNSSSSKLSSAIPTASFSPSANSTSAPSPTIAMKIAAAPPPSVAPIATPVSTPVIRANSTPAATPIASVASSVTPTPTPTATATVAAAVAAAAASAMPAPSPKAKPSPVAADQLNKVDKLNKGDDLAAADVSKKITFQALDDVWVRYQVDEKPAMLLILRKGKYLVIKAKDKILFDTNNNQALRYKTKSGYQDLSETQFTLEEDGKLSPAANGVTGAGKIPETIPESPSH